MRLDPPFTPTVSGVDPSGMPIITRNPLAYTRTASGFSQAMVSAQQNVSSQPNNNFRPKAGSLLPESNAAPWSVNVQSGQTLSGIVRDQMAARGVNISSSEALRLSQTVAQSNKLPNANLIHPGQRINLAALQQALNGPAADNQANLALPKPANPNPAQTGVAATAQVQLEARGHVTAHPVLDKTLERAVNKGFIPPHEKQAVMDKILQMSKEHKCKPDDFARLTLMESDGMNPRSTNNRCHGIIQFCDGPDRGAASAGFGQNPRAILGHSVLQQLDMVGKYFDDTGLKNYGPAGLDDLYLTVLTPAARNETRPDVNLNIAGPQASYLHVNRDTKAPITRASILQGLHQNAMDRLGLKNENGQSPAAARAQAIRVSAYQANNDIR